MRKMKKIILHIINFYLKKKTKEKENSVLITLSGNFLKLFKNSLLNIPQINLSKKTKKN